MICSPDSVRAWPVDGTSRGVPALAAPIPIDSVAKQDWNLLRGDLALPVLVLRDERFRHNLRSMRRLVEALGLSLAPHGKTPMAPQLFEEYIREGGAWGVSVATVPQAAVAAAGGMPHVLIANQVIGRANVEKLAALRAAFPDRGLPCFVDSVDALQQLVRFGKHRLAGEDRFEILIEVGAMGARTGARSRDQVDAIVTAAREHAETVRVVGVGCYEGAIGDPDPRANLAAVDAYLDFAVETFNRVAGTGLLDGVEEAILTGGGSVWFDRVAKAFAEARLDHPARRVLRCGSYPFMDHRLYRQKLAAIDARGGLPGMPAGSTSALEAFLPSLELWAAIQSVGDPGGAIVAMGRRDLPYDQGLPIPLRQYRDGDLLHTLSEDEAANPFRIDKTDDQHAYLSFPEGSDIRVGDLFAFGISHPCTAFDKWPIVFRIDPTFNVTGAVKTFF